MEDQLVSFETAKLAKKKGCDWPTIYGYSVDNKSDNSYSTDSAIDITGNLQFTEEDMKNCGNDHETCYLAPTQSLLQKWLREVHKIHILLDSFDDDTYQGTLSYDVYEGEEFYGDSEGDTYEETLEGALQKALAII